MLTHVREFVTRNRGCILIAGANLLQRRLRLIVALAGTAVPIVLLMMQIAFLNGAREQVTRFYDFFDFDLIVVSSAYQFLVESGNFPRVRLTQAAAADGVDATYVINIANAGWTNTQTERNYPALLFGLDDNPSFVRNPQVRAGLAALGPGRSILVDAYSTAGYGNVAAGSEGELNNFDVSIAGQFQLGSFFYSDGSAIVRNTDFPSYVPADPLNVNFGLIRLSADADAGDVRNRIRANLADDVRVLTRDEFIAAERAFFITTKPIGIMMQTSMWIAFLVGSIILLQVISTDVVNRMKEFATMKAMGFSPEFVFGVGLTQALLLAGGAFVVATAVSAIILAIVEAATHLSGGSPVYILGLSAAIVLTMTILAVVVVVRRIANADPAELY
jgi:putative ABC transport system permease protein